MTKYGLLLFASVLVSFGSLLLAACSPAATATAPPPTATAPAVSTSVPATATDLPTETPTSSPTATLTPTATETPTPTETADVAATQSVQATQTAEIALPKIEETLGRFSILVDSGYLAWVQGPPVKIESNDGSPRTTLALDEGARYTRYLYHVHLTWKVATVSGGCGILFHSEDDLVNGRQHEFRILDFYNKNTFMEINLRNRGELISTPTSLMLTTGSILSNTDPAAGTVNEYILIIGDGVVTIFANAKYVTRVLIQDPAEGRLGLFAWQESYGSVTCTFNNGWIWVLEE